MSCSEASSLTARQKLFAEAYVVCLNATEAARRAGYKGSDNALAVTGSKNIRNHKIRAKIDTLLETQSMPRSEILARLTHVARVDLGEFVEIKDQQVLIKPGALQKAGHLVKSIRQTREGVAITLHDSLAALVQLGKYYGLFREVQEHTGPEGGPIEVKDLEAVRAQRWAGIEDKLLQVLAEQQSQEDD